jgi:hypothetical protein
MSPLETFFAFGFFSVFAVFLLATGFRYLPKLLGLHRTVGYNNFNQCDSQKYLEDILNF